jgi:hypothetical protein
MIIVSILICLIDNWLIKERGHIAQILDNMTNLYE